VNDARGDARPPRRDDERGRRAGASGPRQASHGGKPHPSMAPKRPRRDDAPKDGARDRGRGAERPSRDDEPPRPVVGAPETHRQIRAEHTDPLIPDSVQASALPQDVRNELKTLTAETQEFVARHLAMAAQLIERDPELAHQHAISASRRGGRIGIVRETLAITAYATGDFALALRELRTYRRITGRDDQLPMMVDCERGLGRPDKALELARSVARGSLPVPVQVELAIAMSGARLDLGQLDAALRELEIPQLDPSKAFSWSPDLFGAYAVVLDELGRAEESAQWLRRSEVAAEALGVDSGDDDDDFDVIDLEEEGSDESSEPSDGSVDEVAEVAEVDDDDDDDNTVHADGASIFDSLTDDDIAPGSR
jgi:hypothetical protein